MSKKLKESIELTVGILFIISFLTGIWTSNYSLDNPTLTKIIYTLAVVLVLLFVFLAKSKL